MARAVTHLSGSTPKPAKRQCQNRKQCRRTTATSHQQCTQVVVAASARAVVGATSSIDSPARQALFVTVTRPRHRYSSRGDSHRHILASLPHRSCVHSPPIHRQAEAGEQPCVLTPLTGREPIAGSWMHMRGVRRDVFVPSFSAGPLVSFAVGDRRPDHHRQRQGAGSALPRVPVIRRLAPSAGSADPSSSSS